MTNLPDPDIFAMHRVAKDERLKKKAKELAEKRQSAAVNVKVETNIKPKNTDVGQLKVLAKIQKEAKQKQLEKEKTEMEQRAAKMNKPSNYTKNRRSRSRSVDSRRRGAPAKGRAAAGTTTGNKNGTTRRNDSRSPSPKNDKRGGGRVKPIRQDSYQIQI